MTWSSFLTKENISLALSIISIVITVFNFFHKFYSERVRLILEIKDSFGFKNSKHIALDISITNNSRLPISINKMELMVSFATFTTTGIAIGKKELFKRNKINNEITDTIYFEIIPTYLVSLGSNRGWYKFEFNHIPSTTGLYALECQLVCYCNNKKKIYKIDVPKVKQVLSRR